MTCNLSAHTALCCFKIWIIRATGSTNRKAHTTRLSSTVAPVESERQLLLGETERENICPLIHPPEGHSGCAGRGQKPEFCPNLPLGWHGSKHSGRLPLLSQAHFIKKLWCRGQLHRQQVHRQCCNSGPPYRLSENPSSVRLDVFFALYIFNNIRLYHREVSTQRKDMHWGEHCAAV